MSDLSKKQCAPCRGGVPPLKGPELDALFAQLDGGWSVVDEHHLEKEYRFDDFRQALDFALVHNSRSRSIIALHPEIRGPA